MKIKIYRVANHTSETEELIANLTERYGQNPKDWDWDGISLYEGLSESFIREFKDKVNWDDISEYQKLSESFIREFKDYVGWINISESQKLSEDFIREFKDKVNWTNISHYQKLSEDFIREFQDRVNWSNISHYQKLSENFIREFQDRVNWYIISFFQKLSEDFIREFQNKVFWNAISQTQLLSEDFIMKFKVKLNINFLVKYNSNCPPDLKIKYMKEHNLIKKQDPKTHEIEYHEEPVKQTKPKDNSLEDLKRLISINLNEKITIAQINNNNFFRDKETQRLVDIFTKDYGLDPRDWHWSDISYYRRLTEDFIREFQDKVKWEWISCHQTLSEDFIREFKDKVFWSYISGKQKLSEDFIREFQNEVVWPWISKYQRLSENFIREFKDKVSWDYISKYQRLSEDFIEEFKDKINIGCLAKYNPSCPPDLKIRYMKEHNIIKKQDPKTHEIEYHEEPVKQTKPKDNSLEELKQLISINLNEKVTIAKIDGIMSQSNSLSKPDKNKINRALSSFWKNFDENNIPKTNKELSDLIEVAMFTPVEKRQFLGKIKKELSSKGISLDSLSPV